MFPLVRWHASKKIKYLIFCINHLFIKFFITYIWGCMTWPKYCNYFVIYCDCDLNQHLISNENYISKSIFINYIWQFYFRFQLIVQPLNLNKYNIKLYNMKITILQSNKLVWSTHKPSAAFGKNMNRQTQVQQAQIKILFIQLLK